MRRDEGGQLDSDYVGLIF